MNGAEKFVCMVLGELFDGEPCGKGCCGGIILCNVDNIPLSFFSPPPLCVPPKNVNWLSFAGAWFFTVLGNYSKQVGRVYTV